MEQKLSEQFTAKQQLLSKVKEKHSCGCCVKSTELEIFINNINLDKVKTGFILCTSQFEYLIEKIKPFVENKKDWENLRFELYPKSNHIIVTLKGPLEYDPKPGNSFIFETSGLICENLNITCIDITHYQLDHIIDFYNMTKGKFKYMLWSLNASLFDAWIYLKACWGNTFVKKYVSVGYSTLSKHLEPYVVKEEDIVIKDVSSEACREHSVNGIEVSAV